MSVVIENNVAECHKYNNKDLVEYSTAKEDSCYQYLKSNVISEGATEEDRLSKETLSKLYTRT